MEKKVDLKAQIEAENLGYRWIDEINAKALNCFNFRNTINSRNM
jgi:hypothetical protein